ncbi:hypothetical protein TRSC58_04774 [Trypanosoma rangeli SC58]|uniref:Uncharacterized protein n=1 Tax=Trypanosoma rangeli SC58 TaxID=429131 RepID=A0A061IZR2_TRYRA|nr:hypothetical protein TRSC58_04774 [Trypanosoma rangeli SC58]
MSHGSALTRTLDETGVERFAFSYIFRRVETAMRVQYGSKRVFVTACKDIGQLWSALDCSVVENDEHQALVSLWPQFLEEGLLFMTSESPLLCARAFLESVVMSASCSTVKVVSSIAAANTACVGEIIPRLLSEMSRRTTTLSSLIPPLGQLQEVTRVIELLQEYQLASADNASSLNITKLVEAYNALVERYASLFVEEVAFPSYWNLDLDKSSLLFVNGAHPAIYFCFMSLVRLVQWCGYRVHMIDDVPCRQIVAHVWESGALVVAAVAEEKELSESLKKQLQLDTMHFVLFARMFRKFVGDSLFGGVSCSLLRLLESVARCLRPTPDSSEFFAPRTDALDMDVWNVPPVEASEWAGTFDANGRKKADAFVPWSEEFIRASYVRKAQMPPNDWQYTSFRNL